MKARAIATACAFVALPIMSVVLAPSASACTGAIVQDANGVRCVEGPAPVGVGIPAVGVGVGPYGPEISTGPLLPGQSWNIPLG